MTVSEKRDRLRIFCVAHNDCSSCRLFEPCKQASISKTPVAMSDEQIEKLYQEFMRIKGETTMNENTMNVTKAEEKTITIPISEYRFFISAQSTLSKLEDYAENHEYLNDEVIRALLGVENPAANLESEGD